MTSCASKLSCKNCKRRHPTSICDQLKEEKKLMTVTKSGGGTFPIVTVKANGVTCRALVDSGAGSSYASAKLVNLLHQKPVDVKTRQIDVLMSTKLERLEKNATEVESVDGKLKMHVDLITVKKGGYMVYTWFTME